MARKNHQKTAGLRAEIGVLAEQVSDAIKAAATSRDVTEIRSDIKDSVRSVSDRVAKAVQKAAQSQELADIKGQAKKVASLGKKEGLRAAADMRRTLAAGLDAAGQELQRLAERLKKQG